MLTTQQTAPDFQCPDEQGNNVQLSDFRDSQHVILYFYPRDDTPGCTIEANQFTALIDQFTSLDTVIFGVSKDNGESHQQFIDKFNLKIRLLADTDGQLCEAYGVWQEKQKNGDKKMGIVRSTFIIDKSGQLIDVEYGVTADGHAQAVLEKIRAL